MRKTLLSALLFLFFACNQPLTGDLIISNINIIDVSTGEIAKNQDLVIRGDSIISITDHKATQKYEAKVVADGTGKYAIPGLWDMHTHTWWGYQDFFPLLIANGITGIREMFGNLEEVKKIQESMASGEITGPEIVTAGPIIDGDPPAWQGSDAVSTPEAGREAVRRQVDAGADFIKVYSLLEPEVYFAIADECKKTGISFGGHLPRKIKLEEAIQAGQQFFEHFDGMLEFTSKNRDYVYAVMRKEKQDSILQNFSLRLGHLANNFDSNQLQPLINLLVENNVWICPTWTVNRSFAYADDPAFLDNDRIYFMPDYALRDWLPDNNSFIKKMNSEHFKGERDWYLKGLSIMRAMKDGGVNFLAGTDYPNIQCYPGFSLHDELQILVEEGGFSTLEALQTATINPAIFLNNERTRRIHIGSDASLLLLNDNPLQDINNTRKIHAVVLRGQYLKGDSLTMEIEKIAAKNKLPKISEVLLPIILKQGIATGLKEYHRLYQYDSANYNFDQEQLNTLGYNLLAENKTEEAIAVFELNIQQYPDYENGWDSLGDGYLAAGDTSKTIQVWQIAIEKGSTVTRERLDNLIE